MNKQTSSEEEDFNAITCVCSPTYNAEEWELSDLVGATLSPCPKCGDTHALLFVTTHYRVMCPFCGHGKDACWRTAAWKAILSWNDPDWEKKQGRKGINA